MTIKEIIVAKLTSGKFIATTLLTTTYCIMMLTIVNMACKLLLQKELIGKDIIVFAIGSFTGTAMGAIIGYFFKRTEENGG